MRVRKIDTSHDWCFGQSEADYLGESDAIKQCILTKILEVRGDWFLGLEKGIDWINYLGRSTNLALLEDDLKRAILSVDGVYRIDNILIDLNRQERKAIIQIEYTDIFNRSLVVSTNVRDQ